MPSQPGRLDDLVEGLVGADHAEVAAGALFDGRCAGLQVLYFGREATVALGKGGIQLLLGGDGVLQPPDAAQAVVGDPDPVLEQDQRDSESCGKHFHSLRADLNRARRREPHSFRYTQSAIRSHLHRERIAAGVAHLAELGFDA